MTNSDYADILKFQEPSRPITGIPARFSGAVDGRQKYRWQSRIDRTFARLEQRGIMARHDFGDDLETGHTSIKHELENITTPINPVGYTFYHRQDTTSANNSGQLSLTFGSIDGTAQASIEVGKRVRAALVRQGLGAWWNESSAERIVTRVKWEAHGYGEEDSSGAFIDGPKPFQWFIADSLIRHGFTHDHAEKDGEVMLFGGVHPHLRVQMNNQSLRFWIPVTLNNLLIPDLKHLRNAVWKFNSAAHVSQCITARDGEIYIRAYMQLYDVNGSLNQFVRLFSDDLLEFYASFEKEDGLIFTGGGYRYT